LRLLLVLAFILSSTTAWAGGVKIGQVSVTGQYPNPVNPGKSATFFLSLTRNNNNGSTGAFVANLTFSPFTPPPGVTYVPGTISYGPSTPTSISFSSKQSVKGCFFTVAVDATVKPGIYSFTVTLPRYRVATGSASVAAGNTQLTLTVLSPG